MNNNALILGCGNIATKHVQALNSLKFDVYVFDTDERKAKYFSELHMVKLHINSPVEYSIVTVCVPYNFRDTYYTKFSSIINKADTLVIEKPLRNIDGQCHQIIEKNIFKVWTPYRRVFGLPEVGHFNRLLIKETRGYLHSLDSFKDTVFDLFPHWLSVVVKYHFEPENFQIEVNNSTLKIKIFDKYQHGRTAEIFFEKGKTNFELFTDDKLIKIPQNQFTFKEFFNFFKYYIHRAQGGAYMEFYRTVLKKSPDFRNICDKIFNLTKWIKVDAI